ncbi:PrsW family glutamic-type intramembrane protease [Streptomyces buecherae]|uniref:PrsW family glutamic-type intramembrane protease n=1 Tax=Streptomyces buecherae TaxID=2763006 RepID=UPI0033D9D59D
MIAGRRRGPRVTVLMVAATVYGVAQLLVLSTPTRSIRVTTVLRAIAVGVYGCGAATALLEYAYPRAVAEQPDGRALREAVERASYTVDPVLEEVVKVAPLLLVAGSRKLRRQWGLTDHVVAGGALGAGFGLLEAVSRYGLGASGRRRSAGTGCGARRGRCSSPFGSPGCAAPCCTAWSADPTREPRPCTARSPGPLDRSTRPITCTHGEASGCARRGGPLAPCATGGGCGSSPSPWR